MKIIKKIQDLFNNLKESKENRINDKVFSIRIALSLLSIFICLAAMSFSAFAFFTDSVSSASNKIISAVYELEITNDEQSFEKNIEYSLAGNNNTPKTFSFTLSLSSENTASVGYCKIIIESSANETIYYTKPIGTYKQNGAEVTVSSRTFSIEIPASQSIKITFIPQWGSCSQEAFDQNIIIPSQNTN